IVPASTRKESHMKDYTTPEVITSRAAGRTMAQSKPTPGPWKATAAGIDAVTVSTTLRNGRRVPFRVACCKDGDIDQVQANARLIATAPELLAALKKSLASLKVFAPHNRYPDGTVVPGDSELIREIKTAIAQAE